MREDRAYEVAATDSGGGCVSFGGPAFTPLRCAWLFSFPFSATSVSANAPPHALPQEGGTPSVRLWVPEPGAVDAVQVDPVRVDAVHVDAVRVDTPQAGPPLGAIPVSRRACRVPRARAGENLAWRPSQTGPGLPATAPTAPVCRSAAPVDNAKARTSDARGDSNGARGRGSTPPRELRGDEPHRSRPAGGQSPWSGRQRVTAAREAARGRVHGRGRAHARIRCISLRRSTKEEEVHV